MSAPELIGYSPGPRRIRPYPTYKDSGVEWLGEIPAHWEVRRLKTIASVRLSNVDKKTVEGQESVRLCNYVDVYYHERITADLDFMAATATPDQVGRFSLRAGDVLITKDSESWTDIAVPAVVTTDLPGVLCGYHLAVVRPASECDGAFLARAFSAIGPRDQFQTAANGITRFGLGGDAIRTGLFAIPPAQEQRAIATFLDRETARIDALVARKRRLVELLQEKRTALITRAVTKGLNPNIPMKDSRVDSLGELPAHWTVSRVKHIASYLNGLAFKPSDWSIDGRPIIRIQNLTDPDAATNYFAGNAEPRYLVRNGDILVSWSASLGVHVWSGEDAWLNQHIFKVSPDVAQVDRAFYGWLASWFINELSSQVHGSTMQHLKLDVFGSFPVPLPPLDEQRLIAAFVHRETARIDALVARVREAIDRLKEYRAALVSAAVTGKIDVREEAT